MSDYKHCPKCGIDHEKSGLGPEFQCTHDPNAPCWGCNQPVGWLSMGGANICASCDSGYSRVTGQKWSWLEYQQFERNYEQNKIKWISGLPAAINV